MKKGFIDMTVFISDDDIICSVNRIKSGERYYKSVNKKWSRISKLEFKNLIPREYNSQKYICTK